MLYCIIVVHIITHYIMLYVIVGGSHAQQAGNVAERQGLGYLARPDQSHVWETAGSSW